MIACNLDLEPESSSDDGVNNDSGDDANRAENAGRGRPRKSIQFYKLALRSEKQRTRRLRVQLEAACRERPNGKWAKVYDNLDEQGKLLMDASHKNITRGPQVSISFLQVVFALQCGT